MGTNELTTNQAIAVGGLLGGMMAMVMIGIIVWAVLMIVGWWKMFTKAGEAGWKSLIPTYNLYIAFKIVGIFPWWPVILFVASVIVGAIFPSTIDNSGNVVANGNAMAGVLTTCLSLATIALEVYYAIKLAKAFKKGTGTAILAVFFPNIVTIVLGFGKAKYDKKVAYKA